MSSSLLRSWRPLTSLAVVLALATFAPSLHADDREDLFAALKKGMSLYDQGNYREAAGYLERALELAPTVFGREHESTAAILNNLANLYKDMGQYGKAEPLYRRSLGIKESRLGKDHLEVAISLYNLANLYYATGQHAQAEPLFCRSLAITESRLGKDHPDVAIPLNGLAILYSAMGQYGKAEPLYRRSLDIREIKLGKDHPDVAHSLNGLANLYSDMGQYEMAEPLYRRSLDIRETKLGKDHPDVANSLNDLANIYKDMGQYGKSESLYRRSLKIYEAKLGEDHPNVASTLDNLANLYRGMGQYGKAEPLFRRSLKIREVKLGEDHPDVAVTLNNLANLYKYIGKSAQAEPLLRRGLKIMEVKFGKDHPKVAATLNNLATHYMDMGQYGKAEPHLRRSLEIYEAKFGKDHLHVAASLVNLAIVYHEMGQYEKAEPLYRRGLEIREAELGKDHPDIAPVLYSLAVHYAHIGQYAKAEPLYRRCLEIREAKLGKDHPDVALTLNNLAMLDAHRGRWDAAADLMDRQRRVEAHHVARVLPILAAAEQLKFLETLDNKRANALSLGLVRRDQQAIRLMSAAWLLNAKGVAQETLTQRALLERDAIDPARRGIIQELTGVRQQQAALALGVPKPGQEAARSRQLRDLAERQQHLEQQLLQAGALPSPPEWVELNDVRAALAADTVLISIARFPVSNFGRSRKKWEKDYLPERYAAWLIPPAGKGDVKIIDLGDADKIDAAVRTVRVQLRDAQDPTPTNNPIRVKGEPDAEKELLQALQRLAMLTLQPLLAEVGDARDLILSPDGALWLVPWAALPTADGKYAIENYTIRYAISGRELLAKPSTVKQEPPMVLADPDFDLGLSDARVAAMELLGRKLPPSDFRGLTTASALPLVGRLPGTAREADAIKPGLEKFARQEPWIYKGKNALEAVVKDFHSPKVVVLATHGFFLEDQEAKTSDRPGPREEGSLLTKEGKMLENPLLRCGLLLAGCNDRESQRGSNDEDGVLTGMEIVGCDLRGTELVVLSACETGLGQVNNGEGVAGLRQAFQLAGARSVMATLWQVPDRDTALLMIDFFDNLAKKQSKAEALRNAQLARIKARRDRNGAAHPFFWAAFTITGQ
jgi:CHAT domain-containing protein/tetratricopeptide (TPR) repeat protein